MYSVGSGVGLFYIFFSLFSSLLGFSFSISISIEIGSSFSVIGDNFYYISITSHAVLMVFFFLTTISTGFSYYLISFKFISCFSTINNIISIASVLLHIISFISLLFSLLIGDGVNSGWTLYTPLTLNSFNNSLSLDFAIMSLILFSLSSILSSLNFVLYFLLISNYFESYLDLPVFIWSVLLTSVLVLLSTPSLICVLIMLVSDSNFSSYYFDCEFGGSSILFQSMFWVWGHPEVYILILPIFGLVSESLFLICNGFIYNKNGIVFSMLSLAVLSFLVWGHHMMVVGFDLDVNGFFMISTVVISIPTGVKVFSWLYSLFLYGNSFNIISVSMLLFILNFVIGGITGVFLSNYSLDVLYHDSYFVVGHFHTILASSSLFGLISSLILFINIDSYFYSNLFILFLIVCFIAISHLLFSFYYNGIIGTPSSISNYLLEGYFYYYLGSVGVVGFWFSIVLLLFILISFINHPCIKFNDLLEFIIYFVLAVPDWFYILYPFFIIYLIVASLFCGMFGFSIELFLYSSLPLVSLSLNYIYLSIIYILLVKFYFSMFSNCYINVINSPSFKSSTFYSLLVILSDLYSSSIYYFSNLGFIDFNPSNTSLILILKLLLLFLIHGLIYLIFYYNVLYYVSNVLYDYWWWVILLHNSCCHTESLLVSVVINIYSSLLYVLLIKFILVFVFLIVFYLVVIFSCINSINPSVNFLFLSYVLGFVNFIMSFFSNDVVVEDLIKVSKNWYKSIWSSEEDHYYKIWSVFTTKYCKEEEIPVPIWLIVISILFAVGTIIFLGYFNVILVFLFPVNFDYINLPYDELMSGNYNEK